MVSHRAPGLLDEVHMPSFPKPSLRMPSVRVVLPSIKVPTLAMPRKATVTYVARMTAAFTLFATMFAVPTYAMFMGIATLFGGLQGAPNLPLIGLLGLEAAMINATFVTLLSVFFSDLTVRLTRGTPKCDAQDEGIKYQDAVLGSWCFRISVMFVFALAIGTVIYIA